MIEKDWLKQQADMVRKADWIDPSLYVKYGVKRGLRNADGSGVLVAANTASVMKRRPICCSSGNCRPCGS